MEVAEAKELLDACVREELQDQTFGDAEVFWSRNYIQIADGQFSGEHANVWFKSKDGPTTASFNGDMARELRNCGSKGVVYPGPYPRNHDPACGCDSCLGKDRMR